MQYYKETKTLAIYSYFNEELNDIPKDIEIIIFHNKKSIDLSEQKNIKQLIFDFVYEYILDNYFRINYFNLETYVDYKLLNNLTHLTFERHFNFKIDNFPKNLTHLIFGWAFNRKIKYLPKNLTYLKFGDHFNQEVANLPKNLTHLFFRIHFNQEVVNLPKNLIFLNLGYSLKEYKIPKNIKELVLYYNNNLIDNIPEHIEKIYINFCYYDMDNEKYKKIDNIPLTIKEIIIKNEKYKKYIKIPFGCKLTINNFY
jgi:hypothetical protein